jgi:hypothetical protein
MTKAGFEKVTRSERRIYGPRKLLLCGFQPDSRAKFIKLMEMLDFADIPVVWIHTEQARDKVVDAMRLPNGTGAEYPSELPRAIIVSGVTENELHQLMGGCRQAGMKRALWAVLTPTSEKWRIVDLLKELEAERTAMCANKKN